MNGTEIATLFEARQREARLYAASQLTPANYRGESGAKIANCYIVLDIAQRLNANPLMVMQNLYEVKGKFGWSTQFLIACFNACGRFGALGYDEQGEPETVSFRVRCRAREIATGKELLGPWVSLEMAEKAGWAQSQLWQSMPQLMLRYRAAAFFIRTTAPEISMGFYTVQELEDMPEPTSIPQEPKPKPVPRGTRRTKKADPVEPSPTLEADLLENEPQEELADELVKEPEPEEVDEVPASFYDVAVENSSAIALNEKPAKPKGRYFPCKLRKTEAGNPFFVTKEDCANCKRDCEYTPS